MASKKHLQQALGESSSDDEYQNSESENTSQSSTLGTARNGKENTAPATANKASAKTKATSNTRAKQTQSLKAPARNAAPAKSAAPARAVPARSPAPVRGASKRKSGPQSKQDLNLHREIFRCQEMKNLIPMAPFVRLVRETLQNCPFDGRLTLEAVKALREASEAYLTSVFSDSYLITLNRGQVTLQQRDMTLLMFLRGPRSGGR